MKFSHYITMIRKKAALACCVLLVSLFVSMFMSASPASAGCEGFYSCKRSGILDQGILNTYSQNGKNYVTVFVDACTYSYWGGCDSSKYTCCRNDIYYGYPYPFVNFKWTNQTNFVSAKTSDWQNADFKNVVDFRNATFIGLDDRCTAYDGTWAEPGVSKSVYRYNYTFEYKSPGNYSLDIYSLGYNPPFEYTAGHGGCKDDIGGYDDKTVILSLQALQNLNVSCSANPSSIQTGNSTTFISSVSGGTGSYTYSWSGACSGSSQNCTNSFSNSGTQTATLNIISGSNTAAATCSVNIVGAPVSVSCSASPNPVQTGQTVTFAPLISGGSGGAYNYYWSGACVGYFLNCTNSFNSGGNYTATLTVSPFSSGQSSSANCSITVNAQSFNNYLGCYNNDVYWFDNYGNRQQMYQDCGDTYCDTTGSNYCVGNSIYRQRTCYNRGCAGSACYNTGTIYSNAELVQTCGYGQTCQNGYCTSTCECTSGLCCDGCHYKSAYTTCNTETQTEYGCPFGSACGSDVGVRTKTRNQYCSGYSSQCTGSWSNWTGLSDWRIVDYCSTTQTCYYGNPICQTSPACQSTPSYISHYLKSCYDSDLYWYDSLNVRQEKYRDCQDTNDCTIDSCSGAKCVNELKCDGTACVVGSANYCSSCEYCGDKVCNCGETMQSCSQDCSVIGLAVTIFGKKENDPVQWLKTFSASAGQKLDFLVVVSNGQEGPMNNVIIKTDLPQEIIYKGDLKLDGNSYDGDIRTGVNLGTLATKTVKTFTFKGEITGPENISRGEVDAIATVNTSSGSSSDNIKINLIKEGQQIVVKPEGFLAALLKINLNSIYILLGIIIAILILIGFVKFKKK